MSKVFTLFLLLFFFSCNKEEIARNAVLDAMTSGYWKVVSFKNGAADVTSDFSSYKFQFKENLTVDAINNTTVEKTGSWNADTNAKTITSSFTNAGNPLILLNGTWQITNSDWTFVEASQTVNGELRTLRMEKI
jgi:hypothetical protein